MWAKVVEALGESLATAILFAAGGSILGIGRLLNSGEPISTRLIIGRAISTGGIAVAAGSVLVWVPGLPMLGMIGVAALLASLGTSGLERLLSRLLGGKGGAGE